MQGICQDKPLQLMKGGKQALEGVEKGWKGDFKIKRLVKQRLIGSFDRPQHFNRSFSTSFGAGLNSVRKMAVVWECMYAKDHGT